ncbi:hypothetical protein D3C85_1361100 [compost metagenome]
MASIQIARTFSHKILAYLLPFLDLEWFVMALVPNTCPKSSYLHKTDGYLYVLYGRTRCNIFRTR